MISRRPRASTPHNPNIASPTRSTSDGPTTADLIPLSAAHLCIHISEAGGNSLRNRRLHGVSQEALRQALYIQLQRSRRGDRQAADQFGSPSLEELVSVYARGYSDWENLKAREIVAELNLRFAREQSAPRLQTDAATRPAAAKSRALLVDDSPDILITVGAFLMSAGFEVDHLASGDRALDILTFNARVDFLVTDHAMPGLCGKDLVFLALENRPDLRAVIITGYPNATELADLPPRVELLAKPFRRLQLTECLRKLSTEGESSAMVPSSERAV